MACKITPSGKTSIVYKELNKNYDTKLASDAYYVTNSEVFREWFGDWKTMAEEFEEFKTSDYGKDHFRTVFKLDRITNPTTQEPNLYYLKPAKVNTIVNKVNEDNKSVLFPETNFASYELATEWSKDAVPVFLRNNNIASTSTENHIKYNLKASKTSDGKILLSSLKDVVRADTGLRPYVEGEQSTTSVETKIANKLYRELDPKSINNTKLKAPYFKFTNSGLETNYSSVGMESSLLITMIPAIVNKLAKSNPKRFKSLYSELIENPENNLSSLEKQVARTSPGISSLEIRKEILAKGIIHLLENSSNTDSLTPLNINTFSRLNQIKSDFVYDLSTALKDFNLIFTATATMRQFVKRAATSLNARRTSQEYGEDSTISVEPKTALGKLVNSISPVEFGARPRGEMEQAVDAFISKTSFDNSPKLNEAGEVLLHPHTKQPILNHIYTNNETKKEYEHSVSGMQVEFPQLQFENSSRLLDMVIQDEFYVEGYQKSKTRNPDKQGTLTTFLAVLNTDGKVDEIATLTKKKRFVEAVLDNDLNSFFADYPLEKEFFKIDLKRKRIKVLGNTTVGVPESDVDFIDRQKAHIRNKLLPIFTELTDSVKEWATRPLVGTKIHDLLEPVMREEDDRTDENRDSDLATIAYLEGLPQAILDLSKAVDQLEDYYKDFVTPSNKEDSVHARLKNLAAQYKKVPPSWRKGMPLTASQVNAKNEEDVSFSEADLKSMSKPGVSHNLLIDINRVLQREKEMEKVHKLYTDLLSIKAHIKSKGGIIKVEVKIHSDNVITHEHKQISLAGQIDILAIYEDNDSVDPEYRGQFEIYDYKTSKRGVAKDSPDLFTSYNKDGKKILVFGGNNTYLPKDQMGHTFQQLLYSRIIETALGWKFRNAFIIPIVIPGVNTYSIEPTGNYHVARTSGNNGRLQGDHPLVLNIRTFKDHTVNENGEDVTYFGFNRLNKIVRERIPSDNTTDPEDKNAHVKEIKEDENRVRNSKIADTLIKITAYMEGQLRALRVKNQDASITKAERSRIKTLGHELNKFNDMGKLWYFALDGMDDILGKQNEYGETVVKSLMDVLKDALLNYKQSNSNPEVLKQTIETAESIRLHIQNYSAILGDIKAIFDQAPEKEREAIKADKDYKRLESAVAAIKNIEDFYFSQAENLLAEKLASYASQEAGERNAEHSAARRGRYEEKLAKANEILNDPSSSDKAKAKAEAAKASAESTIKTINLKEEQFTVTKETILRDLKQLPRDIGIMERYLLSPTSTSDASLALYMKMVKFSIMDAETALQRKGIEMQKFVETFLETTASKHLKLDSEKVFEKILEKRNIYIRRKNDDGENETVLVPVTAFRSEYGTQKYKRPTDTEYQDLSYAEIRKDYYTRLSEAKDEGFEAYQAVNAEFKQWEKDNFEAEFIVEYYQLEELFTKDSVGKEAKKQLDVLNKTIWDIRKAAGNTDLDLSEQDEMDIAHAEIQKLELASLYTADATPKTGEAMHIAMRLQEYNELRGKIFDYTPNTELFEFKRSQILKGIDAKYKKAGIELEAIKSPEYFDWLSKNEDISLTQKFYNKFERLKLMKDLAFYAEFTKNGNLQRFLTSLDLDLASDTEFPRLVEKTLEKEGITMDEFSQSLITNDFVAKTQKKIRALLAPYRKANKIDTNLVPRRITLAVKKLEEFVQQSLRNQDKLSDAVYEAYDAASSHKKNLANFVEYKETNDYWAIYYKEEAEAAKKGMYVTATKWYKDNHYAILGKEDEYRPISLWTTMSYAGSTWGGERTVKYYKERQTEILKLVEAYPGSSQARYDSLLSETEWYKKIHDERGGLLQSAVAYKEVSPDSVYVARQPNYKYVQSEVKPEYKRVNNGVEADLIYDATEKLLPIKSKWINPKWQELQADPVWAGHYKFLRAFYEDAQQQLPEGHRMGDILPFIMQDTKESLAGSKPFKDKAKILLTDIKESFISSSIFDVVTEGDKTMYESSLDHKHIPMPYTMPYYADDSIVTKDVISSIMKFARSAYKHKALSDVLSETRMLSAIYERRESAAGGGVLHRDSLGNTIQNALTANSETPTNARQAGRSKVADLLQDVIKMQIFGQMNTPHEVALWFGKNKTIRLDKLAQGFMTLASITQIGGLNSAGVLKGVTNSLQAELQMHIERSANRYFTKRQWHAALAHFDRSKAQLDSIKDFGQVAATTLSGQLKDHFDPLQGEFLDQYGNKISGSKANKLMAVSTWFFNQRIGEFRVAMASMFAIMDAHKIVNGEVYNLHEYLAKLRKEALANNEEFGFNETLIAEQEFHAMTDTLREAYVKDKDGFLSIRDGVNWQLGSTREKALKARLHAINTSLHGNYASFTMPVIQTQYVGNLVMMYKKYLLPNMLRRFGRYNRDEELGDMKYGYIRNFFALGITEFKTLMTEYLQNILIPKLSFGRYGGKADTKLSPLEKENIRRAVTELTWFLGLMMIAPLFTLGADDEEEYKKGSVYGTARYTTTYLYLRLLNEMGAMLPQPEFISDNWRLLKSPSAINGFVDRVVKVYMQLWNDPTEQYKTDYGIAEKGDYKLEIALRKLVGTLALPGQENFTLEEIINNQKRN